FATPFNGVPKTYFQGYGYMPGYLTIDKKNDLLFSDDFHVYFSASPYSGVSTINASIHVVSGLAFSP
ncbi:MAG: hypothetical protein JO199_12065, partial [Candidatus Eremiobacteraeota bacterium]|nr:hypothetical protein [Candidatus Eremiobacteraeota bacterium]